MTNDPTESPQESSESNEVTLENKRNISLVLLAAAWFIPFLWPFAIAGTIGMFPKSSKKVGFGLLGVIGFAILAATINGFQQSAEKPTDTPSNSAPATSKASSGKKYIGTSKTGYELWADENCVYVKGITEGDLARLGTDVWGFKKAVKAETGYSCVLYE